MSALRELLAEFDVHVDDKQLDKANEKIEGFIQGLKKVGSILLGGEIAKGLFEFAHRTAEIGEAIEVNAARLGVSTDAYQQLGFAASVSGSNIEEMSHALSRLEESAGKALQGGESAKAFTRLGISVKDARGEVKTADALFSETAEKISKLGSASEQAAAARDLFGRGSRTILPLLKKGAEGLAELREEAEKLGGGYSEAAVAASTKFEVALKRQDLVMQSIRGRIAIDLLPLLQRFVDTVTAAAAKFLSWIKNSQAVQAALLVLGSALAFFAVKAVVAMAPVLVPILLIAAALAAAITIVDELIVTFHGGKSVIRAFVDGLFGLGTTEKVVENLKVLWQSFADQIKETYDWVVKLLEKLHILDKDAAAVERKPLTNQEAQRREAVKRGGSVRFRGESKADADAANQKARDDLANENVVGQFAGGALAGAGLRSRKVNALASGGVSLASNTTIHVTQQPGEDGEKLARRIRGHIEDHERDTNRRVGRVLVRESAK